LNSGADGTVFEFLSDNDDGGSAYDFNWETKRFDFDHPENDKWFQDVEFVFNSTDNHTVEVFAQIDGNGYNSLGTVNVKGAAPALPVALPFDLGGTAVVKKRFPLRSLGWGRDIQFKIENNDANEDVELRRVVATARLIPLRYNQ